MTGQRSFGVGDRAGGIRRTGRRSIAMGMTLVLTATVVALAMTNEKAHGAVSSVNYGCTGLGAVALDITATSESTGSWFNGVVTVTYQLALPALAPGESVVRARLDTPTARFDDYHAAPSPPTVTTAGGTFSRVTTTADASAVHVNAAGPAAGAVPTLPDVTVNVAWGRVQDNIIGGQHSVTFEWSAPSFELQTTARTITCTPAPDQVIGTGSFPIYYGTRVEQPSSSVSGTVVPTSGGPTTRPVPTTFPTTVPTTVPTTLPTTVPPTTVDPLCQIQRQVPRWLWSILVQLLGIRCR